MADGRAYDERRLPTRPAEKHAEQTFTFVV